MAKMFEMMKQVHQMRKMQKQLAKKEVVISRRDTGEKNSVKLKDLDKFISRVLEEIQEGLFKRAKKLLYDNIVEAKDLKGIQKAVENRKIAFSPLCSDIVCEDDLKVKTGAKVLNIPRNQPAKLGDCAVCGEKAKYWAYVGKSY